MNGKLFIFCAPSGSGKTTIVKKLLDRKNNIGFSISATTRFPREGEIDGKGLLLFITSRSFRKKLKTTNLQNGKKFTKVLFTEPRNLK